MESFSCQPLFDRLTHVAIKTGALHNFAQLNDSLKRVKFCWNINVSLDDVRISFKNEIRQILEAMYGMCADHEKSETLALQVKEKGSKAYLKKKDAEAHQNYSESLRLAPNNSKVLSLAYGNRSAVLCQMGRYQEALDDMNRAEQNGYPSSVLHKLLSRRCSCYIMLGDRKRSEETLEHCKRHLEVIDDGVKDKFEKTIVELEKKMENLQPVNDISSEDILEVPPLFEGESASVTYLSSALEMRVTDAEGRHIVAVKPVEKGSVVFVEKPYAAILLPEHHHTHCHQCFAPATNPIPCRSCRDAVFCKEECREQGHLWHQYECGILHLLSAVGIAHLALRVILTAGWKLYCEISKNDTENRISGVNSNNVYNSANPTDAYRSVYHLMPHLGSSLPEDQLQYCLAGLLLATAVLEKTNFSKQKNADDVTGAKDADIDVVRLGCAMMRHIAQLVANAHAITQVLPVDSAESTRLESVAQKRIASAIYPTASLMNHSCQPTIINSFINNLLVIRTIEDVKNGDQIYNCYGPHYCRQTFQERQRALTLQYFFTCKCGPCTQPHYRLREASWSGFQCPSCKGVSSWSVEGTESTNNVSTDHGLLTCLECHKMEKPSQDMVEMCTKVNTLQEVADDALQVGDLFTAILNLRSAIGLGCKVYLPENQYFLTLKDTLAKALGDAGDFEGCCQSLRECLQAIETRYGSESIEFGHELLKFSDVLELATSSNERNNGELKTVRAKINKIFTLNYGAQWKKYLKV